jgi:hypothetical protein
LEQQINTNITNGRMTRIFFLSLFFNRVIHFFVPFASTPQRPFGINPSLSSWKPLRAPHSPQGFHTLRQGFSPPTTTAPAASSQEKSFPQPIQMSVGRWRKISYIQYRHSFDLNGFKISIYGGNNARNQ